MSLVNNQIVYAGATSPTTVSTTNTVDGSITPAPLGAAGVAPISGIFTAAEQQSNLFTPIAGRSFNIAVWNSTAPGSSLGGTVYLTRSTDGGSTFLALTANGTQLEEFTVCVSEIWQENQYGVQYRLVCSSYSSGVINYRLSQ